jgi:hypothetical protein
MTSVSELLIGKASEDERHSPVIVQPGDACLVEHAELPNDDTPPG